MKDVAVLAGVTQPTVSYVINGTANISDEVKEKVLQAIDTLGYKPNMFARVLRTNQANIIGIIIPDIVNQYFSSMVALIESRLSEHHRIVIIGSTNYETIREEQIVQQMLSYHVNGIILLYQMLNAECWKLLKNADCPVVAIECGADRDGLYGINVDNHFGGSSATKYLLAQGRRRIAYVGQNVDSDIHRERCQGYLDAMAEAGLRDRCVIYNTVGSGNMWSEGAILGEKLIRNGFDGAVTSSDILAVGVIKKLLSAGVRVPEDIAVTGYDDIPLAELFVPALTTIRQPMQQLCAMAVERILSPEIGFLENPIAPLLVVRDSA